MCVCVYFYLFVFGHSGDMNLVLDLKGSQLWFTAYLGQNSAPSLRMKPYAVCQQRWVYF